MNDLCQVTVGDLRKTIENMDDDCPIYYEVIHDSMFTRGGWTAHLFRTQNDDPSPCVRAFAAYDRLCYPETPNVPHALVITAHY